MCENMRQCAKDLFVRSPWRTIEYYLQSFELEVPNFNWMPSARFVQANKTNLRRRDRVRSTTVSVSEIPKDGKRTSRLAYPESGKLPSIHTPVTRRQLRRTHGIIRCQVRLRLHPSPPILVEGLPVGDRGKATRAPTIQTTHHFSL